MKDGSEVRMNKEYKRVGQIRRKIRQAKAVWYTQNAMELNILIASITSFIYTKN